MQNLNYYKDILEELKQELYTKYPISSLGLFGSVLRDDFNEESDIDIVVDFHKPIKSDFITLAFVLEEKLNRKVDLVSRNGIKPKYYEVIESEILYV